MLNEKKVDKYVYLFVEKSIQEAPGQKLPLNFLYQEYKSFVVLSKAPPVLYKHFLSAVNDIVTSTSIEVKKENRRWYIYNAALVTTI